MEEPTQGQLDTVGDDPTRKANVGTQGGDFQTRIFSLVVLISLSWSATPYSGISLPVLKIFSLVVAIIGAQLLMIGLVFSGKTHYAGLVLLIVPLIIYWVAGTGITWLAPTIGALSLLMVIENIVTHRCALNRLLNINSSTE